MTCNTIKRHNRLESGRCPFCAKIPEKFMQAQQCCWECWLKGKAFSSGLGRAERWIVLENQWFKQEAKCAYTGVRLVPGVNASLDHIIPRAKGGLDLPENLHWVDINVNSKKSTKSHEDFVKQLELQ